MQLFKKKEQKNTTVTTSAGRTPWCHLSKVLLGNRVFSQTASAPWTTARPECRPSSEVQTQRRLFLISYLVVLWWFIEAWLWFSVFLPSPGPLSCVQTNATVSVFCTDAIFCRRTERGTQRGARALSWRYFFPFMEVVVLTWSFSSSEVKTWFK